MKKTKKLQPTNCILSETCSNGPNCTLQLKSDNYLEEMVIMPDCFTAKEQIKIKIEKPKFLRK